MCRFPRHAARRRAVPDPAARRRTDALARLVETAAQRVVRNRTRRLARARRPLPGARDLVARSRRRHGRVPRQARGALHRRMNPARIQRVAAYNVCVDAQQRLLLCRLSAITEAAGAWTLPGGGIDFGEHPEAGALRELTEETGLEGRIVELLAVDSIARLLGNDPEQGEYHSVRVVYRTEIVGGTLRSEVDGSTDAASWFTRDDVASLSLVSMGSLGATFAWPDAHNVP